MKIACNYSPELMKLMDSGDADVDFFKAKACGLMEKELVALRKIRPVLLHGLGNDERTGMPGFEAYDYTRANRLLEQCGSPHLAIHLCITNADAAPGMTDEEIYRRMVGCALSFKKNLSVPLLLENIADSPDERTNYYFIPFVEPEKIGGIMSETGAGMLLDIAHAKVTAQYRRWDVREYIQALPLCKVREIHVSGTGIDAGGEPFDAHDAMQEEDYELLDWVLGYSEPEIVSLEFGWPVCDLKALHKQLVRLRGILPIHS
jgi:uncharacterized protein